MDISKYASKSGASVSKWGPSGWDFLFISIIGGYPMEIENNNTEHLLTKEHYKRMLMALQYTLPCIYCRISYKQFIKELSIDKYLSGRISLMYWLYLIKDKVNNKLIKQEQECYNIEKKRLKNLYKTKQLTRAKYYKSIAEYKLKHVFTKKSPPFKTILDKYEKYRSGCSLETKKCM